MVADASPERSRDAMSSALRELADRYWQGRLAAEPIYATATGDRRFDSMVRDDTPEAIARERAALQDVLDAAEALDPTTLDDAERLTLSALRADARGTIDALDAGLEPWAVDPLHGPQVQFFNVESFQPVRTPEEGNAMVERWRAMGRWFDSHADVLRDEVAAGRVAVRDPVAKVLDQVDDLLAQPDDAWALLNPLKVERADWSPAERAAFEESLRAAVRDAVRPALQRYGDVLRDEILPRARPSERPGIGHL
ncbi:MAG: DUF885 family protein, partial [Chloroflexota bacterium]|nr:DUF885 family protein [Chloroflexota bacterium]